MDDIVPAMVEAAAVAEEEEEGEDDDPSSSPSPLNIEQQLEDFRSQWQQELTEQNANVAPSKPRKPRMRTLSEEEACVEDEAAQLFMLGVNAEQHNKLYEAIRYYRRAVQLVPDIEFRVDYGKPHRVRKESECSMESVETCEAEEEEEEEEEDLSNLIAHLQRVCLHDNALCYQESNQMATHISALPVEVVMYILKWVISTDLDVYSLESVASVCRGFYLCARDEELWRLICKRIWGINVGRPGYTYSTWRNMYLERPHLKYNGCYISKMQYYRLGEQGLDNFYQPYHLVEYYRYVRFFPEGQMYMLTSPELPMLMVPRLRMRGARSQGLLHGYYKMAGDHVTAILKRSRDPNEYNNNNRYKRSQRNLQNAQEMEQTYHLEFVLKNAGKRSYSQLIWQRYEIHTKYKGSPEESITKMELTKKSYPPMIFSRVKSYTSQTENPLQ